MRTPAGQRGRHLRALAVLALIGTALASPPASAGGVVPVCQVFDLSPAFARDGTAFCAVDTQSALVVFRSKDRGRTWTRLADGVRLPDRSSITQLVVSAGYPDDRTVYVATSTALYASYDDGATFVPVDALAADSSGRQVLARYLDTSAGVAVPYLAFAAYRSPARLRPPVHEAVAGPLPANTYRFLMPPSVSTASPPLAVGFSGSGAALRHVVHECSVTLVCATPRGAITGAGAVTGVWMPPHQAGRTVYASGQANGISFVRSTDGGRTFRPWTSLNTALAPLTRAMARLRTSSLYPPALAFAADGRIYVRVFSGLPDDGTLPPAHAIFRSDNGGATWRQVAAQYDAGGRRRGNLPFKMVGSVSFDAAVALHAAADGRVFALGDPLHDDGPAVWCSVDGGVRWYRVCPR